MHMIFRNCIGAYFGDTRPSCRQIMQNPDKYLKIWSGVLFSITCAIRVAFIFESKTITAIRTPTPGMDVDLYWQAGRLISQGACTNQPCFEQMISSSALYPYWIAFWQMVLGQDMLLHRLLNASLTSLSAVLIFRLMFKLTNQFWAALVCILIWAALPSLIFFDAMLYKVSLAILFLSILLTLMVDDPPATRTFSFFIKGLLMGLLLSVIFFLQSATFLFLVVAVAFYALHGRLSLNKKVVVLSATLGIFSLVVMGYHFKDTWSNNPYPRCLPQKGIHFRIGFNEYADGTYVRLPQIDPWSYGHNFQARMVAEVALGHPLTPAEADRFHIQQGLKYILGHPMASLGLVIKKTVLFFNNYQAKGADDFYLVRKRCHPRERDPQ